MNAALNALNVWFDKGKALVKQENTCSGPVISRDVRGIQETTSAAPTVSAYPNPFNDKVRFVILSPVSGKATLEVFNMVGQKLRTVFNGQLFAGQQQVVEFNVPVASRVNMVYILKVNGQQLVGKLINAQQ